jgi:hypothetical protein
VKFDRIALGAAIGAGSLGTLLPGAKSAPEGDVRIGFLKYSDLIVPKGAGGLDANGARPRDVAPIAEQQRIGDTFCALSLLAQQPIVSDAIWNRVP